MSSMLMSSMSTVGMSSVLFLGVEGVALLSVVAGVLVGGGDPCCDAERGPN